MHRDGLPSTQSPFHHVIKNPHCDEDQSWPSVLSFSLSPELCLTPQSLDYCPDHQRTEQRMTWPGSLSERTKVWGRALITSLNLATRLECRKALYTNHAAQDGRKNGGLPSLRHAASLLKWQLRRDAEKHHPECGNERWHEHLPGKRYRQDREQAESGCGCRTRFG